MGFGVSENFNAEGQARLKLEPGIYLEGSIGQVKVGSKKKFGTEEIETTIDVIFISKEGGEHIEQIVDPNDEKKSVSMFERLIHIANAVKTEEQIAEFLKIAAKTDGFPALATAYSTFMTDVAGEKVDFKVVGSVYNGNALTKVPNFSTGYNVPFISKSGKTKIAFTNGELSDNEKYKAKLAGASISSGDPNTGAAGAAKPKTGDLF